MKTKEKSIKNIRIKLDKTHTKMNLLINKNKEGKDKVVIEDLKSKKKVLCLIADNDTNKSQFNNRFDNLDTHDKIIITDIAFEFEFCGMK